MDAFWVAFGAVVLALGLLDVFLTALNYDEAGFLATPLCALEWRCLRAVTRRLSRRWRPIALRQITGLQIGLTVTTWLGCVIVGFGFIYFGLMYGKNFQYDGRGLGGGIFSAMYLSAAQLSTVGTSQITPETDWLRALTILETLSAALLVSLILTFLLGVYQVVRDLRALSSNFFTDRDDAGDALASLSPYFPQGQPTGLDGYLQAISGSFWTYADGMRLHHIAYYFQSGRDQFSLPYTLHMMGRILAALRWGLPSDHPASMEPALTRLITQFERFADYLHDQLRWTSATVPEVVCFEDFSAARNDPGEPRDLWLGRFVRLDRDMARLARLAATDDPAKAYERYRQWLPFAYSAEQTTAAVSRDLDYQPLVHGGEPGIGDAKAGGPSPARNWRQSWRVMLKRWVAVPDPGLIRLTTAAGAALAAVAAVATLYLLFWVIGRSVLPAAMFGGMVGVFAATMPSDARAADRKVTTALIVLPALGGAALGVAVSPSFAVSIVVLACVVLLGVGIGDFGPRFEALGQMAFMGCYFALLLHADLALLPFYAVAAIVGAIWAFLFRFIFITERPRRIVRGGLDAFRARMVLMLDSLIDAVSAARWDPDLRKRVRADLRQLRRSATFLQGRLRAINPDVVQPGAQRGDLRLLVFDAELAATSVMAAAREFARAGAEMPVVLRGELAGILDHAQDRLRRQDSNAPPDARQPPRTASRDDARPLERWPVQARRLNEAINELLDASRAMSDAQAAALTDSAITASHVAATATPTPRSGSASDALHANAAGSWLRAPRSRRAVQASIATGIALLAGAAVTSAHQYWAALAAFLVLGGTSTVEETVMKGVERVAGTLVGAIIGFGVAILTGADPWVVLPLVVFCIFAGMYLRPVSYALMVFWMTILLALLYEFLGELTTEALQVRVAETAIGAAVALAAATLILPIRTRQKVNGAGVALLKAIDQIAQACLERLAGNTEPSRPWLANEALVLDRGIHQLNTAAEPLRRASGALGLEGIERRLTAAGALAYYARQLIKSTEAFTGDAAPRSGAAYAQVSALTHDNITALIRVLDGESPGQVHRGDEFPGQPGFLPDAEGNDARRAAAYALARINQAVLALIEELTPAVAQDSTPQHGER